MMANWQEIKMTGTLAETLEELCRLGSEKACMFLVRADPKSSFVEYAEGSGPDKYSVTITRDAYRFAGMEEYEDYCIIQQGFHRNSPEPYFTVYMVSMEGELLEGGTYLHPWKGAAMMAESHDPFTEDDLEGIEKLNANLISLLEQIKSKPEIVPPERYGAFDAMPRTKSTGQREL